MAVHLNRLKLPGVFTTSFLTFLTGANLPHEEHDNLPRCARLASGRMSAVPGSLPYSQGLRYISILDRKRMGLLWATADIMECS